MAAVPRAFSAIVWRFSRHARFIPCPPTDELLFWGYDWIKPEQYEERIKYVTENPRAFLHLGDVLNKGTLHTLHMLAETKSDEERAAIWISAFLYDVLDSRIIHSDTGGFSYKLHSVSYGFFEVNITYGIMP